jgi:hypothetical protein
MKVVLCVCAVALIACWDEVEPQTRPRGPGITTPASPSQPEESDEDREADPFAAPIERQPAAPEAADAPAEEEEPERDYAAELRDAVGSPASCLKPRIAEDAPDHITISVEATVMNGGNISRSYVTSTGLDAEELECVQRQVSSKRLPSEVEDAPRSVVTSIELELKKPEKPGG